jgi:hypothetical protein
VRNLTGFYVYGAICYLLIGMAAIAWHNRVAFTIVATGCAAGAISSYTRQGRYDSALTAAISWVAPGTALLFLIVVTL